MAHLFDRLLLGHDRVLEVPHFNCFLLSVLRQVVPKLLYLGDKRMAFGQEIVDGNALGHTSYAACTVTISVFHEKTRASQTTQILWSMFFLPGRK